MTITCAKCNTEYPDNVVYDRWACSTCGNPITAYIECRDGMRISTAEVMGNGDILIESQPMTLA